MVYSDLTQNSECTMFVWKHSFDTPGTTTAAKQQRFLNAAGKVAVVGGYRMHSERVEIDLSSAGDSFVGRRTNRVLLLCSPSLPFQVFSYSPQSRKA
jgi:hypothetical protein